VSQPHDERLPVSSPETSATAQIGVTGLAVMGSNIARNFAHHGYTVALHNRSVAKTDALLEAHGSEGKFVRSETIPEFLAALEKPRRVLIMVKAGDPTDAVYYVIRGTVHLEELQIDRTAGTLVSVRRSGCSTPSSRKSRRDRWG